MKENIIINDDCVKYLSKTLKKDLQIDLSFLDPPFNQGKDYRINDDDIPEEEYWAFMKRVCKLIYNRTSDGGSIYFMQREKNTSHVMKVLEDTGWTYQNLIIWKKKTSAVPQNNKFGLHYQIIVFATKGDKPRVFNKLRINPPRLVTEKYERPNGMYVTDIWDDIRELTSGYFAGEEALRQENGERFHKQQSPISLLLRIILSSSNIGDLIFDPFAGTGTTLVVAKQLSRKYIGVEIDPKNVDEIKNRLTNLRGSDNIEKYRKDYLFTENLNKIWNPKNAQIDN
jgi:DNA modification methylase